MGNYQRNQSLPSTLRKIRIFQKLKPLATLTITAVILALRGSREFFCTLEKYLIMQQKIAIQSPHFAKVYLKCILIFTMCSQNVDRKNSLARLKLVNGNLQYEPSASESRLALQIAKSYILKLH